MGGVACPAKCQKWKRLAKKKILSNSTGVWAPELPWQVSLYRVFQAKICPNLQGFHGPLQGMS